MSFIRVLKNPFIVFAIIVGILFESMSFALPAARSTSTSMPRDSFSKTKLKSIPRNLGKIQEVFDVGSGPEIILIQDPHHNYSGQKNISLISKYLFDSNPYLKTVFLEAGFEKEKHYLIKQRVPADDLKNTADLLLPKSKIQGIEHFYFTTQHDVDLVGVEDKTLYQDSWRLFGEIISRRYKNLQYLARVEKTIAVLKKELFHSELLDFDLKNQLFALGKMSIPEYAAYLEHKSKYQSIDMSQFAVLKEFTKSIHQENLIDYELLKKELKELYLSTDLKSNDSASKINLDDLGLKPNSNNYSHIFDLMVDANLKIDTLSYRESQINSYPMLRQYASFVEFLEELDIAELIDDMSRLRDLLEKKFVANEQQDELITASRYVAMTKKILDINITPKEYVNYTRERRKNSLSQVTGQINQIIYEIKKHHKHTLFLNEEIINDINKAEQFYALTQRRDVEMLDNLSRYMNREQIDQAVLIVGGYHAEALKQEFRRRGLSYASITPNVYEPTNRSTYEKALIGQDIQDIDLYEKTISKNTLMLMRSMKSRFALFGLDHDGDKHLDRQMSFDRQNVASRLASGLPKEFKKLLKEGFYDRDETSIADLSEKYGILSEGVKFTVPKSEGFELFGVLNEEAGQDERRRVSYGTSLIGHEGREITLRINILNANQVNHESWIHFYDAQTDQLIRRAFYYEHDKKFVYDQGELLSIFTESRYHTPVGDHAFRLDNKHRAINNTFLFHLTSIRAKMSRDNPKRKKISLTFGDKRKGSFKSDVWSQFQTIYIRPVRDRTTRRLYAYLSPNQSDPKQAVAVWTFDARKREYLPDFVRPPGTVAWLESVLTGETIANESRYIRLKLFRKKEVKVNKTSVPILGNYIALGRMFRYSGKQADEVLVVNNPKEPERLDVFIDESNLNHGTQGLFIRDPKYFHYIGSVYYDQSTGRFKENIVIGAERVDELREGEITKFPKSTLFFISSKDITAFSQSKAPMMKLSHRVYSRYKGSLAMTRFVSFKHKGVKRNGVVVIALDKRMKPIAIVKAAYVNDEGKLRWFESDRELDNVETFIASQDLGEIGVVREDFKDDGSASMQLSMNTVIGYTHYFSGLWRFPEKYNIHLPSMMMREVLTALPDSDVNNLVRGEFIKTLKQWLAEQDPNARENFLEYNADFLRQEKVLFKLMGSEGRGARLAQDSSIDIKEFDPSKLSFAEINRLAFQEKNQNAIDYLLNEYGMTSNGFIRQTYDDSSISLFFIKRTRGRSSKEVLIRIPDRPNQGLRFRYSLADRHERNKILMVHVYTMDHPLNPNRGELLERAYYDHDEERMIWSPNERLKMWTLTPSGTKKRGFIPLYDRPEIREFSKGSEGTFQTMLFRGKSGRDVTLGFGHHEKIMNHPDMRRHFRKIHILPVEKNGERRIYGYLSFEHYLRDEHFVIWEWKGEQEVYEIDFIEIPGGHKWFWNILKGKSRSIIERYLRMNMDETLVRTTGKIGGRQLSFKKLFDGLGVGRRSSILISNSTSETERVDFFEDNPELNYKTKPTGVINKLMNFKFYLESRYYNQVTNTLQSATSETAERYQDFKSSNSPTYLPKPVVLRLTHPGPRGIIMSRKGKPPITAYLPNMNGERIMIRFVIFTNQEIAQKGIQIVHLDENLTPIQALWVGYELDDGSFKWMRPTSDIEPEGVLLELDGIGLRPRNYRGMLGVLEEDLRYFEGAEDKGRGKFSININSKRLLRAFFLAQRLFEHDDIELEAVNQTLSHWIYDLPDKHRHEIMTSVADYLRPYGLIQDLNRIKPYSGSRLGKLEDLPLHELNRMAFHYKNEEATQFLLQNYGLMTDGLIRKLAGDSAMVFFYLNNSRTKLKKEVTLTVPNHANQQIRIRYALSKNRQGDDVLTIRVYNVKDSLNPDKGEVIQSAYYDPYAKRMIWFENEKLKQWTLYRPKYRWFIPVHNEPILKTFLNSGRLRTRLFTDSKKGINLSFGRQEKLLLHPEIIKHIGKIYIFPIQKNYRKRILGFTSYAQFLRNQPMAIWEWNGEDYELIFFEVPGGHEWFGRVIGGEIDADHERYVRMPLISGDVKTTGVIRGRQIPVKKLFNDLGIEVRDNLLVTNSIEEPNRVDFFDDSATELSSQIPIGPFFKTRHYHSFIGSEYYDKDSNVYRRALEETSHRYKLYLESDEGKEPPRPVLRRLIHKSNHATLFIAPEEGRVRIHAKDMYGERVMIRFTEVYDGQATHKGVEIVLLDAEMQPVEIFKRGYMSNNGKFVWLSVDEEIGPLKRRSLKVELNSIGFGSNEKDNSVDRLFDKLEPFFDEGKKSRGRWSAVSKSKAVLEVYRDTMSLLNNDKEKILGVMEVLLNWINQLEESKKNELLLLIADRVRPSGFLRAALERNGARFASSNALEINDYLIYLVHYFGSDYLNKKTLMIGNLKLYFQKSEGGEVEIVNALTGLPILSIGQQQSKARLVEIQKENSILRAQFVNGLALDHKLRLDNDIESTIVFLRGNVDRKRTVNIEIGKGIFDLIHDPVLLEFQIQLLLASLVKIHKRLSEYVDVKFTIQSSQFNREIIRRFNQEFNSSRFIQVDENRPKAPRVIVSSRINPINLDQNNIYLGINLIEVDEIPDWSILLQGVQEAVVFLDRNAVQEGGRRLVQAGYEDIERLRIRRGRYGELIRTNDLYLDVLTGAATLTQRRRYRLSAVTHVPSNLAIESSKMSLQMTKRST